MELQSLKAYLKVLTDNNLLSFLQGETNLAVTESIGVIGRLKAKGLKCSTKILTNLLRCVDMLY